MAENPILTKSGEPDKRYGPNSNSGRPSKPIDWKKVDQLLIAGCKGTEIAAHFDMHPQTLYDKISEKYSSNFTDYSREKKELGESLLREKQFSKALGYTKDGDNTLLIWLGKQRLDQHESPIEVSVDESVKKELEQVSGILKQLQSAAALKIESKSEAKEDKSECVGDANLA